MTDTETDWRVRSHCRDRNAEIWFPAQGDAAGIEDAKRICRGCPVRLDCVTNAADRVERFGVRGGYFLEDRADRRRMYAELGRTVPKLRKARPPTRPAACVGCGCDFYTRQEQDPKCLHCRRDLVAAGPALEIAEQLRAAGWVNRQIATAAQLPISTIENLRPGRDLVSKTTAQRVGALAEHLAVVA